MKIMGTSIKNEEIFNKQKFLEKFLEICQDQVWDENLISQTLTSLNIDKNLLPLIFQNPIEDLYQIFWQKIDEEMLLELRDLDHTIGTGNKITKILETRLLILSKYQLPLSGFFNSCKILKNLKLAIKTSYDFADLSWKLVKDQSTDYNYYTKRLILSKIYIKSLIFFNKNRLSQEEVKILIAKEISKTNKIGQIKQKLHKDSIKNHLKNNFLSKIPFIRLKI